MRRGRVPQLTLCPRPRPSASGRSWKTMGGLCIAFGAPTGSSGQMSNSSALSLLSKRQNLSSPNAMTLAMALGERSPWRSSLSNEARPPRIGLTDAVDPRSTNSYIEAKPVVPMSYEMHEAPSAQMADLVEQVVLTEGPVHLDEVIARLRGAWGLQRAGGRIQASVERGLAVAVQRGRVVQERLS